VARRILIVLGHPDPAPGRLCRAVAEAYAAGAAEAGHQVKQIDISHLEFPLLRSKADFDSASPPPAIRAAQEAISWCEHLVIVYPLWLGSMPALLKGFFEQVFRPGFAADRSESGRMWRKRLTGRSARIVVTMGMPALVYRWFFGAHSLKSLERNILKFAGIGPIRETLIGLVEAGDAKRRSAWLRRVRELGIAAR
jgi:putative NADPH-quinone reductase